MNLYPAFRQRGGFNYITAILLLIVAAIAVVAIFVAPKYYANYMLTQDLWALMVRADEINDRQIESELSVKAAERGMPLAINQIQCFRDGKVITCHYEFEWPAGVPGLDKWILKFSVTKNREITKVMSL